MSGDGTETVPLPEPVAWGVWVQESAHKPDDLSTFDHYAKEWAGGGEDVRALYTRAQVEHYGRECAKAGAEGERAAVVAWLRKYLPALTYSNYVADNVERGEHL